MFPVPQALAEYVGLSVNKVSADVSAALRQGMRLASEHFVVLLVGMAVIVALLMLTSGSRR